MTTTTANYFLGYFVNQDGASYAKVYDEEMPQEEKNKLLAGYNSQPSDVWDQLHFCSRQEFEKQKETGFAK